TARASSCPAFPTPASRSRSTWRRCGRWWPRARRPRRDEGARAKNSASRRIGGRNFQGTGQPGTPIQAQPPRGRTLQLVRGVRALRALPRVVWLLGLASFLNDVSSEAIFPLLPMFLASMGAPMRYLGLIEGSADALASVIKMIAGRLSDRG